MLYFSELRGKKIFTEDEVYVGKLQDLVFLASESPTVTKLLIKGSEGNLMVPISFLSKVNGSLTINKGFQTQPLEENEIFVAKNLLDKQIIDIKGNKIVRVNDIAIHDKPNMYIGGVDIGIVGVLRWIHMERVLFNFFQVVGIKVTSRFLSWGDIQPLELTRGRVLLKKEEERLEKIPPEDLADHLEKTNILNIEKILGLLDEKYAAEVVGNLNINYQRALFRQISPENAAKVISLIDTDEAVDILLTLSSKRRETIMNLLEPSLVKELNRLVRLSHTPIGELLTSDFIKVSPKSTVREVIAHVKKQSTDFSFLNYVYIVNPNDELVGVVSLFELTLQNQDELVYKFMTQSVTVIHLTTPVEIAIKKILKYKLFALPVIDNEKHILGIVTFDDVAEIILKNYM